jgi:hypothetical protein
VSLFISQQYFDEIDELFTVAALSTALNTLPIEFFDLDERGYAEFNDTINSYLNL